MSVLTDASAIGQRQQRAAVLRAEMQAREQARADRATACAYSTAESEAPNQAHCYKGCGPVGEGEYIVGQGDCISSIAAATGHLWERIWDDPANAALKVARGNPNALLPGDRVTIPNKTTKAGSGETEMRHRFIRHGEPTWLVLKMVDETGAARTKLAYTLVIDGDERAGITDGDGRLREHIPGRASLAVLRIEGEEKEQYSLKLGHIDPVREVSGMQARLNNLGYGCGRVDGKMGPRTLAALNRFRSGVGLPTTDKVDEPTLTRLEEYHDYMESIQRRQPEPRSSVLKDEEWVESPNSESTVEE